MASTMFELWFAFENKMHGQWLLAVNGILLLVVSLSPLRPHVETWLTEKFDPVVTPLESRTTPTPHALELSQLSEETTIIDAR